MSDAKGQEVLRFLQSVKTAERMPEDLRKELSVETGLEQAVLAALRLGRDVVLAGSAGSGKTHLLLDVAEKARRAGLPPLVKWPYTTLPPEKHIRVVLDATAVRPELRGQMFCRDDGCVGVVVAINEGPLLRLADSSGFYRDILDMLHLIQRGGQPAPRPDLPVVFDLGGYDPLESGVLDRLLALPALEGAVNSVQCACEDARVCVRRQAWTLLQDAAVRARVNQLLKVVNLPGQPVLFRDLWDFIHDIAVQGSCTEDPPTSPWFWRVFHGDSSLSKRLREVIDPAYMVFPRAAVHLWYEDWGYVRSMGGPAARFLPPPSSPRERPEVFKWIASQLFFLDPTAPGLEILRNQVDLQLMNAVQSGDVHRIVAALNGYMTYGKAPETSQELTLWADTSIERHTNRPAGQFALGRVPAWDFEVSRSYVVGNHPEPHWSLRGARYFLVHKPTKAALNLTPATLDLLSRGRSYRSADRPHTDLEWHIARFYYEIVRGNASVSELSVLRIDFRTMEHQINRYRLSVGARKVEPWRV